MAALARLFRSSSSSAVSFIRRSLSTEAAVELRSQSYSPRVDPKARNVQWVFLGSPGVGKGTYASRLSALLGVPHIATGDLVREELSFWSTIETSCFGCLSVAQPRYRHAFIDGKCEKFIFSFLYTRVHAWRYRELTEIVNQGKLVSDEIIINLLSKRLEMGEAKGESGFILDGFPRTVRQAFISVANGPPMNGDRQVMARALPSLSILVLRWFGSLAQLELEQVGTYRKLK
ncbi:UNVERIFIED_CONTAM: adenylate kinase [Sesamum radiatum]|uniref:adenylate kinase n=1 Tax=Sesamum radiatum TaxID=300843 RepID=A0AAW2R6C8_SESRA